MHGFKPMLFLHTSGSVTQTQMGKTMLPQEVKDKIEAAMCLIYECGENRDDVLDNLNNAVADLINDNNESDFLEYRFECEAKYEG